MNQKLLSGFAVTLLISTLGLAPSGYADSSGHASPSESADETSEVPIAAPRQGVSATQVSTSALNPPVGGQSGEPSTSHDLAPTVERSTPLTPISEEKVPTPAGSSALEAAPTPPDLASPQPIGNPSVEVVKVGEYQTHEASRQTASSAEVTVATIHPHHLRGRQAATLYVRNIPVLTFLGEAAPAQSSRAAVGEDGAEVKVASVQSVGAESADSPAAAPTPADSTRANSTSKPAQTHQLAANEVASINPSPTGGQDANHPVWRATAAAARLNQLFRDNVSASDIKIGWDNDRQKYVIRANDTEIVAVDDNTVLPDTIANASNDMLQATNRIRRQMGNASPLSNIEGDPNSVGRISLGPIQLTVSGLASWYGPGFDGNYSASGEVFNQNAMTAAHPSLPFGTQVRVTNLDNGQSVVVRINDRGPYAHGRVIDLSAGAARIIGLVSSGVAPVSLEVLGAAQTGAN
ncbi:MAG: septal ring lytic transglycosylase RlpA family protein [Cyanobacteria bacterium RM1_2_2]|nr:septal ring lytic transglycosylase RlpA family protein [Cyanobacteria bacterium RM1_2_2]